MGGWTASNWQQQGGLRTALRAFIMVFIVDKVFSNTVFIGPQLSLSV